MGSGDDDEKGKIIEFPGGRVNEAPNREGESEGKVILTKEKVFRLIKALSVVHMATTYRARKNESCKENIRHADFPCKLNCACYVNITAAMGLESFFGGETQEEAKILIDGEHEMMKAIYKDLHDEDED